jgi:(1->4)-alpha-D-glucan 1-alpha-D-glucosylmutase
VKATYRLQLGPALTFADVRALVPYLADLGISHLYLSPVLQARPGSTHGYDVVDPDRVSEELGGEDELRELCRAGLGVVIDVVPNHMATAEENDLWRDPTLRRRCFDVDEHTGRHRRFFDIDDLAGVRVEDPQVFEATHRRVLELAADGLVDGFRIDHVDGLADPRGDLERLSAEGVGKVWVEKILEAGEELRDWPVAGTTGYEFANDVQALFVDPDAETVLTELAGEERPWHEVASEAKLEQATSSFVPEVERLRRLLDDEDIARSLAALPVYRTYVEPWSGRVEQADRDACAGLPERLRRVMLLEEPGHDEFVTRFQQTSGAVMAKGVEDTAFYRYVRLLALNEVGGDPGRFGIGIDDFHRANELRARRWPEALLAGTTHDTKRSADARARIGVLGSSRELAEQWAERARRWHAINGGLRSNGAPDWTEELLVYQTLVGAWPLEPERLEAYVEKALREAKRTTSWIEPNEAWERSVKRFCRALYDHAPFRSDFEPFAAEVARREDRVVVLANVNGGQRGVGQTAAAVNAHLAGL